MYNIVHRIKQLVTPRRRKAPRSPRPLNEHAPGAGKAGRNAGAERGRGAPEVSRPGASLLEWDMLDEAGWESFPASDPPAVNSDATYRPANASTRFAS